MMTGPLQRPPLPRCPVLQLLQQHTVDYILPIMVLVESVGQTRHRNSPPARGRSRTEVDSPEPLALRQTVPEHVVVWMRDQPFRNLVEDLRPVGIGSAHSRL